MTMNAKHALHHRAIIVLENGAADRTPALQSLLRFLRSRTESDAPIRVIVYDNSPSFSGKTACHVTERDLIAAAPENGGLAPAYNLALHQAIEQR